MARSIRQIGPFFGLMTSVNPADVPDGYAQNLQNVQIEDGKLRLRRENTTFKNPALTAPWSLNHILGYSGTTEKEEYLSVMNSSGNIRLHSVLPDTPYTVTEVKDGVASVNLHASDWNAVAFEERAFLINPNNTPTVYAHTIGDNTSLDASLSADAPTVSLTARAKYSSTSYQVYDQLSWTGINFNSSTDVFCENFLNWGGNANLAATNGGSWFEVWCDWPEMSTSPGIMTIDLTNGPGAQDWTYNDLFNFVFESTGIHIKDIKVSFITTGAVEIVPQVIEANLINQTGANQIYHVLLEFLEKDRSAWSSIKKIKIEWYAVDGTRVTASTTARLLDFRIGCVDCTSQPPIQDFLEFSYSYYDSVEGLESKRIGQIINGVNQPFLVLNSVLQGQTASKQTRPLGIWLELGLTASPTGAVDKSRIYVREQNGTRLEAEQNDATTTYLYRQTINELRLKELAGSISNSLDSVKNATPFKGWMVWLTKGGFHNVRHSHVGEPLHLASETDPLDDDLRGADFSLADNFGDEPVVGFQAGDALVICGKYGTYGQTGNLPSTMSPCRKVPGSFGVANQFAACRWHDQAGNPGVAFIDPNLTGVWFVQVDQSFDGDQGYRLMELSSDIRPTLAEYFAVGTVRLVADDASDSLWVLGGDDALVLRRNNVVNGQRMWERYKYNTELFSYITSSPKRGLVGITSDTKLWTLDDAAASNAVGSYGGTETYLAFWRSKDFAGPNRRVMRARVHPAIQTTVNGPTMTFSVEGCDRTVAVNYVQIGSAVSPGKRHGRYGFKTQGWQFSYQISYNAGTFGGLLSIMERVEFEELTVGNRHLS